MQNEEILKVTFVIWEISNYPKDNESGRNKILISACSSNKWLRVIESEMNPWVIQIWNLVVHSKDVNENGFIETDEDEYKFIKAHLVGKLFHKFKELNAPRLSCNAVELKSVRILSVNVAYAIWLENLECYKRHVCDTVWRSCWTREILVKWCKLRKTTRWLEVNIGKEQWFHVMMKWPKDLISSGLTKNLILQRVSGSLKPQNDVYEIYRYNEYERYL